MCLCMSLEGYTIGLSRTRIFEIRPDRIRTGFLTSVRPDSGSGRTGLFRTPDPALPDFLPDRTQKFPLILDHSSQFLDTLEDLTWAILETF